MSQILGTGSFEDRLGAAFRGDAGEQKKRREERRISLTSRRDLIRKVAQDKASRPSSVGSNVFKSNLGGTNR